MQESHSRITAQKHTYRRRRYNAATAILCVVSSALILFPKPLGEFATLQTQQSHSRQRFPLRTSLIRLPSPDNRVTTVLPIFSPAWKLYWKTANKNLSDFHASVIIYLGCSIQVLWWKGCFIPSLPTAMGHLIQTSTPSTDAVGDKQLFHPTPLTLRGFSDERQPSCQFP